MNAKAYGELIVKRKWLALLVGVLFTVFWIMGLSGLSMNPDNRVYFSEDNPQLLALEALENTYSRDDNVYLVLAPKDKNVFTPKNLEAVRELTERLWQTPLSRRVNSITNFQWTRADGDDITISDLVEDGEINSKIAENARIVALEEPLIKGLLVDAEGLVTGINVETIMPEDPIASGGATVEIMTFIRNEQAIFAEKWPEIDLYVSGGVPLTLAFTEVSMGDISTLLPLTLLVIFVIAGIALRSILAAFFTALIAILATIGMMGAAGYMGVIINAATSNAPMMLIILTIAHCVHIMSTQRQQMRTGMDKNNAIVESLRVNLKPVFITAATTSVGFLSMHFSDSPPFRELGYMLAAGNLIAFVNASLVLPSLMAILPVRVKKIDNHFSDTLMNRLGDFVVSKQKILFRVTSVFIVLFLIGISNIKLDDTWTTYFSEEYDIRTHSDFLEDNLTGLNTIEYSVPAGEEGGINNPEYLADLD